MSFALQWLWAHLELLGGLAVGSVGTGLLGLGKGGQDLAAARNNLQKARQDLQKATIDRATADTLQKKAQLELEKAQSELERTRLQLTDAHQGQKAVLKAIPADCQMEEYFARFMMRDDGSVVYFRRCSRITARHGAPEVRIPYRIQAPQGSRKPLHLLANPAPLNGLRMVEIDTRDPSRFEGDIVIPAMAFGTGQDVGFTVETELDHAFVLTKEDAAVAFASSRSKQDYFGSTLTVPAQRLTMEVHFPSRFAGVARQAQGTVYYGESEIPNLEEIERLKGQSDWSATDEMVTLTVREPVKGQMYTVAWDPPPAAPRP
jgi:hypothetical protein